MLNNPLSLFNRILSSYQPDLNDIAIITFMVIADLQQYSIYNNGQVIFGSFSVASRRLVMVDSFLPSQVDLIACCHLKSY